MKKTKIPEVWDDCKTKEEKKAFIEELERIDREGKFTSAEDFYFEEYMKELGRNG